MERKKVLFHQVNLNPELQKLARSLYRSGCTFVCVDDGVVNFLTSTKVGDIGDACLTAETVASYGSLMDGENEMVIVVALLDLNMGDDDFYYCQRIISYYCQEKVPVITDERDFEWFLSQMMHPTKETLDWIKRKALSAVSLTQLAVSVEKDRPNPELKTA